MNYPRFSLVPAVLTVLSLGLAPAAHAQTGIVAWWQANGNFNDSVGGHNGTPVGPVTFADGRFGKAFNFNGDSARIFIPDSSALELSNQLALSAWIWVRSWPANEAQVIFRGDDRLGLDPYFMTVTGPDNAYGKGNIAFEVNNNNNDWTVVLGSIKLGEWIYVVGSEDSNGHMQMYVNGEVKQQAFTSIHPLTALDSNYSPGLGIGNVQSSNYDEYFDGLIDDVKIYNTANPVVTPSTLTTYATTVHGGDSTKALVTMTDSPFTPLVVTLTSSSSAVKVPATATVSAGIYTTSFAVDTTKVTSAQSVTITAAANGITSKATISVVP